jgi:hypothetical protein
VSAGVAFNQNDGFVLLKSGFSRDVYVIGTHHKSDPSAPGAGVVVLVCAVVKVLFSGLRRRRKRSCSNDTFNLTRYQMVDGAYKSSRQFVSIYCIFYRKFCIGFSTDYLQFPSCFLKFDKHL